MKMPRCYRSAVVLLCVFTFCSSRLRVVKSANASDSAISQDTTEIVQKISAEDTSDHDNTNVTTNGTILNGTHESDSSTLPSGNANTTDANTVSGPECVIKRSWFWWWNVHLTTGHSHFSSSDCALKVCNVKGDLDSYSCNRLDAWDVLRPTIDREVNEGQLKCLKTGCI